MKYIYLKMLIILIQFTPRMNIAQKSARYADLSDVSASAKFCVVVMERRNIRAFPSVRPMITDEIREDGDGGKMTYLSKGTIFFIDSVCVNMRVS